MRLAPLYIVVAMMTATLPARGRAGAYLAIASAVVEACDEDVECMAELVAISRMESFHTPGARGPGGEVGPWQVMPAHLPKGAKTPLPEQAAKARDLIAQSKDVCGDLTLYTSGRCGWGRTEAVHRQELAHALLR